MVIQQNAFILPVESEPAMQDEDTALQKISERIRQFVNRIYYPCCGFDRRFESIFPQAAICYLDQNVENLKNLETQNIRLTKNANEYVCQPQSDLWVLMNPTIFPEKFTESIRVWWWAIVNNTHRSADILQEAKNEFRLIGCENLMSGWEDEKMASRDFEKVTTVQEWQVRWPTSYRNAATLRAMFHGQFEAIFGMDDPTVNLLEWHRRTQPLVRALQDRWTAQEQPGYVGISDIIYEIYLANFPALPKKRRVLSENIYLFQKEV